MTGRTLVLSTILVLLAAGGSFGQPITGTITGTFDEVLNASGFVMNPANSIITGEGTNSLSLVPNRPDQVATTLEFTGQSVAAEVGTPFVMGTLNFFNGDWWYSPTNPALDLTTAIFTAQSDSAGNPSFTVPIGIYTTPNSPDPVLDADFVYFVGYPELGSFRVYEDTASAIEVIGAFGSLDLVGFGDIVAGNGFWNPSVAQVPTFVPVPGAILLVSLGSAGVAYCRRKRIL